MISDLNNFTDKDNDNQDELIRLFKDYDNNSSIEKKTDINELFDEKFIDLEEIESPVEIEIVKNSINAVYKSINFKINENSDKSESLVSGNINNSLNTDTKKGNFSGFNIDNNTDLYVLNDKSDEFSLDNGSLINEFQEDIHLINEKDDDLLRDKLLNEINAENTVKREYNTDIIKANEAEIKIEKDKTEKKAYKINKENLNISKKEQIPETVHNIKQNDASIKNDEIEEISEAEPVANADGIEELESMEDAQIEELVNNIDDNNETVKNPGNIELSRIDEKMKGQDIEEETVKDTKDIDHVYGVNRVQVFYNIEKQLYRSRKTVKYSSEKLAKVRKGLFLPLTVAFSSLAVLFILLVAANIYISFSSKSTLEDNYFKDDSIMSLLNKEINEERRIAMLKLEEERRLFEEERKNRQYLLKEELQKKESEIENKYKQKLDELNNDKTMTRDEIDALRKKYEDDKSAELNSAKDQSIKNEAKINDLLMQKENELAETKKNIEQKETSIQAELDKIKQREDDLRKKEEEFSLDANKRIEEKKYHDEEIRNFNATVYQLISSSMEDFKKRSYEKSQEKLNAVLQYYQSRIDFVKSDDSLVKKMDTDVFFVESIRILIDNADKTVSRDFQEMIKKFDNIIAYYKNAEIYHNEKNYEKSGLEYSKVLEEIAEINVSYQRIKDIERFSQNAIAFELYKKAKESLRNGKNDDAVFNYQELIKKAPLSDYVDAAVSEIVSLSKVLSSPDKSAEHNRLAEPLMKEADRLKNLNQYEETIKKYQEVIINYPYSKYVKDAYFETQRLLKELNQNQNVKDTEKELRNKFAEYFNKYQDSIKKGNFIEARDHYFIALKSAFNYYTDNSLNEFTDLENKYIAELISEKNRLNELTQKDNKSIIEKYENDIKEINARIFNYEKSIQEKEKQISDMQLEINDKNTKFISGQKEKDELLAKYENDVKTKEIEIEKLKLQIKEFDANKTFGQKEKDELVAKYETDAKAKEGEIEKLRLQIKDFEANKGFSQKEKEELIAKYEKDIKDRQSDIDKLKAQIKDQDTGVPNKAKDEMIVKYEKDIKDKEAQIDKLKIFIKEQEKISNETERNKMLKEYDEKLALEKEKSDLLKKQLYEYLQKNNELNSELLKYEKSIKDYKDLLVKYNDLEKKYQDKAISAEERDKLQKSIEAELRKKLEKEKQIEVDLVRNELRKEFDEELKRLKGIIASLQLRQTDKDIIELKNQLFARITDKAGSSIAFQFLTLNNDINLVIKNGDIVKTVRYIIADGKKIEVNTGTVKITSIKSDSIYGRAQIVTENTGNTIQVGDLLRN